jgi:hypothetical protein
MTLAAKIIGDELPVRRLGHGFAAVFKVAVVVLDPAGCSFDEVGGRGHDLSGDGVIPAIRESSVEPIFPASIAIQLRSVRSVTRRLPSYLPCREIKSQARSAGVRDE